MTNLDSILKSKYITFPSSQGYGFSSSHVWMWSWTVTKAECQIIDIFELWCWRRFLRVPWTARSTNQSILKEISPGCSLEGLMQKLKLQYFGHLMQSWLIGKDLGAWRVWWQEEKGTTEDEMPGWHHWFDGPKFEWTLGLVMDREAWRAAIHRVAKSWTRPSDWTELNSTYPCTFFYAFKIFF